MKHSILIVFCFLFLLSLSAMAADQEEEVIEVPANSTIIIEAPEEPQMIGMQVLTSVAPITSSDSDGFKAVILNLLGDYDPTIIEYEYRGQNGTTQYLRQIEPDYPWLCSAAIFLVVVWSVFRLGGNLWRK